MKALDVDISKFLAQKSLPFVDQLVEWLTSDPEPYDHPYPLRELTWNQPTSNRVKAPFHKTGMQYK